ncbi:3'-phosphoadenosine 5'-phosphosulfate sulfotransferase (PAPS reductase)/FAD synthetase [Pseudomonas sp. JAI115]|uniref:phosphoadenosine phosphosulfate reductase family protein n=1 Tax=Pseudomonas sp. JAI115 TaxID=2723061 RepID=UPI00162284DC|nr:phosphoadenosine phosphosulfate reductase family protein [Pseudomonas sp. JAI115]MBB6153727.1 3'-phosphoadenosine 5'-phosphosulfate sulfotransferase (PAPS reductase)/FAD synthetase [Pseudomonas sp. JAI115]
MQNIVSVSGGKASTATLLLAIVQEVPNLQAVFADTAHEQCLDAIPALTQALTATNQERCRFICEIQTDDSKPSGEARPRFIHQSFRM